jgi:hypothetical protein
MAEEKKDDEKLLTYVGGRRNKVLRFYDVDDYQVKFIHADHPERYILIPKQALASLARAVQDLAERFTK